MPFAMLMPGDECLPTEARWFYFPSIELNS
jgi:hypothetical protein